MNRCPLRSECRLLPPSGRDPTPLAATARFGRELLGGLIREHDAGLSLRALRRPRAVELVSPTKRLQNRCCKSRMSCSRSRLAQGRRFSSGEEVVMRRFPNEAQLARPARRWLPRGFAQLALGAVLAVGLIGAGAANARRTTSAPDGPGALSHFDLARKDCLGTARNTTSKTRYTVANGVLSDLYYPTVDNTEVETLSVRRHRRRDLHRPADA